MNYNCAKFYVNIPTKVDTTNIFPFLAIFSQNIYDFTPKNGTFWTYAAWHHSLYH